MLDRWGVEKPLSSAGLFHSIYGTEGFQARCARCLDVASFHPFYIFDPRCSLRWLTWQLLPAQDFSLGIDRRDEVRAVIGERAEFLAYCNCVMVRRESRSRSVMIRQRKLHGVIVTFSASEGPWRNSALVNGCTGSRDARCHFGRAGRHARDPGAFRARR